jgi:hypothetical protein
MSGEVGTVWRRLPLLVLVGMASVQHPRLRAVLLRRQPTNPAHVGTHGGVVLMDFAGKTPQ